MEFLLTTVNDWLKHAEGKHAVLLGLNAGIIGLVFGLMDFNNWSWSILTAYYLWAGALLLLSIFFSILSFLPVLQPLKLQKSKEQRNHDLNPMYFGHAALMEPEDLAKQLTDNESISKKDIWMADQIIVNSRIAMHKYRLFAKAVMTSFFAVLPPIALISQIFRYFLRRSAK